MGETFIWGRGYVDDEVLEQEEWDEYESKQAKQRQENEYWENEYWANKAWEEKQQEQAAYDQMYKEAMEKAETEHYKSMAYDEGVADLIDAIKTGTDPKDELMRRRASSMARVYFLAYCQGMHAERARQNKEQNVLTIQQ